MRKVFNGRMEREDDEGAGCFRKKRRRGNGNFTVVQADFTLNQQGHRAVMAGLFRVLVNQLMQRGARRHRIEQQNHTNQQTADGRRAELIEMFVTTLQSRSNLVACDGIATVFHPEKFTLLFG